MRVDRDPAELNTNRARVVATCVHDAHSPSFLVLLLRCCNGQLQRVPEEYEISDDSLRYNQVVSSCEFVQACKLICLLT